MDVTTTTRKLTCPDGLGMTVDLHCPADGPAPLTLLCHGFKGFRLWGLFPHLARQLAMGGRAVALFDLSHNGTSGGEDFDRLDLFETQTVSRHVEDMLTVLDALWSDADEVDRDMGAAVVGHSLGGGVALLAAARDKRLGRVCALNGVSHFRRLPPEALELLERNGRIVIPNARTGQDMPLGRPWFDDVEQLDLTASCQSLDIPTLILHGQEDSTVPPDEALALEGWLAGSTRVEIPAGDHTLGARHPWQGWTDPLHAAARALDEWLPCRATARP
jgi:pimeloyl-ACP methyl ester carboxylesterase